jgi:ABC-type lipoprotein export system ATPase subunit
MSQEISIRPPTSASQDSMEPKSDLISQPSSIIRTEGLAREYRMGKTQVHALQGINLSIQAGEFVVLMGPSGCGKSTLLSLLGCLDRPSAGSYFLEGRDVSRLSGYEQARIRNTRIGFIFQNFFLLAGLNALENVALPLLYQRSGYYPSAGSRSQASSASQAQLRATQALAQVGLSDRAHHRPMELSGGERQRVAIARALVSQPVVLLADEPTGALDSTTGAELMELLVRLWKDGLSILLVTHDSQVAAYAQRILFMRDGKIIREEVPPLREISHVLP